VPTFTPISQGFISIRQSGTPTAMPSGPRCAVTLDGEVVCSFIVQAASGLNDFKPMLARSADGGVTWKEQGLLWPHLQDRYSIFGSVSRAPKGELFFYGSRTPIGTPGESFWCDATQGLKQNELIWARSVDGGRTWSDPAPIPMPIPGSAEAPGALCVARDGTWHACYAPYNTFDSGLAVDRSQIVHLRSADQGATWRHASMLRFPNPHFTGAEAWVVELADGRLLGVCWNLNQEDGSDFPNVYALSLDGGKSWTPTRSTGIRGQSTALAALPEGGALFAYNQRKHGEVGVWLAGVDPVPETFGVRFNEIVWRAAKPTVRSGDTAHSNWTDFAFGEPSVALLPDGHLLVAFWCIQPDGRGIRYVKGCLSC